MRRALDDLLSDKIENPDMDLWTQGGEVGAECSWGRIGFMPLQGHCGITQGLRRPGW